MKRASIFVDDVFCGVLVEDAEGYHFFLCLNWRI